MEFKNTIFAILAVFCVIFSACAVSATTDVSDLSNDYYLDGSHDGHDGLIIPPDNTHDEAQHAAGGDPYLDASEDGHNGTIVPPDANHSEAASNITANAPAHAAGGNTNSTNATATHTMPATGNPIILLLVAGALVGGYAVIRRK